MVLRYVHNVNIIEPLENISPILSGATLINKKTITTTYMSNINNLTYDII